MWRPETGIGRIPRWLLSGTWNSAIQTAGLFWGFHLHLSRGLSCPPDIDVDSGVSNSNLEPSPLPVLRIFLFYASVAAKALYLISSSKSRGSLIQPVFSIFKIW